MSRDYISTRELLNRMGKGAMDAAKRALEEGAKAVKTEAKSRCPVYRGRDKRVVPGALRDSIHCVKRGGGTSWRIVADAHASDGTPYGKLVEFSPKINKPFLYPALDAERDAIKKNIVEAVKAALRREGK